MARDLWPALLLAVGGLVAVNEARKLRFGSILAPGPGFFPLVLAAALALVGVFLVVHELRRGLASAGIRPGAPEIGAAPPSPRSAGGRFKVVATMAALPLYTAALEPLGFLLSTFGLLVFFFVVLEGQRWWVAVLASAATSTVTYVVFKVWLLVRLPPGLLGF